MKLSKFNGFYNTESNYFGDKPSDGLVSTFESMDIPIGRALDIGAGEGRNSFYLESLGFEVTSIEPDVYGASKISSHDKIEVINSGILEFNTDKKFDFILAGTSLDQLPQAEIPKATSKIIDMLAPGGHAYILVFTEEDPQASECAPTIGHYFLKGELKELFTHPEIEILFYNEYMKIDKSHGPTHYHGKAKLILKKR